MKKWPLLLIHVTEALIVLAAVYFEPTYCVRGNLWGEAFFEGRPTSYWRAELERWEVKQSGWGVKNSVKLFSRNDTWLEKQQDRWLPEPVRPVDWRPTLRGPQLLWGNEEAVPVLQALLDDPSPNVKLFAQIGLGMNPKIPGDDD